MAVKFKLDAVDEGLLKWAEESNDRAAKRWAGRVRRQLQEITELEKEREEKNPATSSDEWENYYKRIRDISEFVTEKLAIIKEIYRESGQLGLDIVF